MVFLLYPLTSAAALTNTQIQSVLSLLFSFGVSQSTITRVQSALTRSTSTPASGSSGMQGGGTCAIASDLAYDATGAQVTCLQQGLLAKGYSIPALTSGVAAFGYFGTQTRTALAHWQADNGVSPANGYFGAAARLRWQQAGTGTGTGVGSGQTQSSLLTLALGATGTASGVSVTPLSVVEDSRCPQNVQCIQAGRVRVATRIQTKATTTTRTLLLGEPATVGAAQLTLTTVVPARTSTSSIQANQYRFTYKIMPQGGISYTNASSSEIQIATPQPSAVTGQSFRVVGQAAGSWYFEGVFPAIIQGASGATIASTTARAQSNAMTQALVPFTADFTVPSSYQGAATVVLSRSNPSGLPTNASVSFPITIAY